MRVLHLRASNFYGGPERQLHFHALAARGSGFDIEVASFTEAGAAPAFLRIIGEDGIPTRLIPVRSAYDRSAPAALRALVHDGRFDVLATHDYRSHLVGWLALRHGPCRWLAFSRGFTRENFKVRLFQAGERFLTRFADRVVAVSAAQKRRLVASGVRAERIDVVHNAIDVNAVAHVAAVDLRARFALPTDCQVVVAAGRFSAEKGQADLLRAATRVLERRPQARFVLFGEGPDLQTLRTEIGRHGQQPLILCPGFEPNVVGCLKGADVVVNPSLSEGLPNVLLEAMALGVPVLATAVGGVPELVEDDVCGRLVPPQQPERLAGALLELLGDDAARARLGSAGCERVRREFSFEGQMAGLANTYRRTATQPR
jgi:glycosyltransferase involved in cell wall biosynthesis